MISDYYKLNASKQKSKFGAMTPLSLKKGVSIRQN